MKVVIIIIIIIIITGHFVWKEWNLVVQLEQIHLEHTIAPHTLKDFLTFYRTRVSLPPSKQPAT
jgi:hypothetical protein